MAARLHHRRERRGQQPAAVLDARHRHQRLAEQPEARRAAAEPAGAPQQRGDARVVAFSIRRHDGERRRELAAGEPPVEVLARLQVAHEQLEHRAPRVRQHRRGEALAGGGVLEAEAVARAADRQHLGHERHREDPRGGGARADAAAALAGEVERGRHVVRHALAARVVVGVALLLLLLVRRRAAAGGAVVGATAGAAAAAAAAAAVGDDQPQRLQLVADDAAHAVVEALDARERAREAPQRRAPVAVAGGQREQVGLADRGQRVDGVGLLQRQLSERLPERREAVCDCCFWE